MRTQPPKGSVSVSLIQRFDASRAATSLRALPWHRASYLLVDW
jgi:hypothetical protein